MAGKNISEATTNYSTLAEISQQQKIPPEIIIEILLRLPPESLTRLRCVCKSWNTIISDPHFIKQHLHNSIKGNKIINHRIFRLRNSEFLLLRSCPVESILQDQTGQEFYIPLNREITVFGFIGSCNGLTCLVIRDTSGFDEIFLCNPCTRESRKFPYKFCSLGVRNIYGFGYDSSTDDYKLVRIDNLQPLTGKVEVDVYTLGTCSGRRIQEFPSGNPVHDNSQVLVNSALHWRSGRHPNMTIIALDLASETYREIPQPKTKDGSLECNLLGSKLGALGGSLVLICQNGRSHYDVWIMREYGVVESWTKLIIVPQLRVLPSFLIRFPRLIHVSKGGEILMVRDNLFVVYSFKEDKFRTLTCRGYDENHQNVKLPWPYVNFEDVGSLVSPNAVMGFSCPSSSWQDGTI